MPDQEDSGEDLPRLDGTVVVITGAGSGIGAATARRLHRLGAEVVPVGRSPGKIRAVARELDADPEIADFADLAAVRALADRLLARLERIDVLLNNAGGIWSKRRVTADNHELTLQVNHLAPFLLTGLLRDRLETSGARVIATSSGANRLGRVDLADLDPTRPSAPRSSPLWLFAPWSSAPRSYRALPVYAASKLANVLVTRELARQALGTGLTATCFDPGFVRSGFGGDTPLGGPLGRVLYLAARTPEQGADTAAWLAAAPARQWRSGAYYADRREARANPQAGDDLFAREFWARSAELVGLDPAPAYR